MKACKTILSVAVLSVLSAAAWAENSTVTTTQSGINNTLNVEQTAQYSSVTINQLNEQDGLATVNQGGGYYNAAIINQQNGGVNGSHNHASILQNAGSNHGNSNVASIAQDGAGYEAYQNASIAQADLNASGMGNSNQAYISQYHNASAGADIGQSGDGNYASIKQSLNSGATANVYQHGIGNQAAYAGWDSINQYNTVGTYAEIKQSDGDYNRGSIYQSNGHAMEAHLTQKIGASNLGYISQSGDDLTARVTQTGSSNTAFTTQSGSYNDIDLSQDGVGNLANIQQYGAGGPALAMNKVNVTQIGNGWISNVTQLSGSGNVATINQHN